MWKCGQDNYPAGWEPLAQGARLEAVTAQQACRSATDHRDGGAWVMGMARRLPFFAHPCLSLRACTFLSSALWDNAAGEKRGPDLAAPEEFQQGTDRQALQEWSGRWISRQGGHAPLSCSTHSQPTPSIKGPLLPNRPSMSRTASVRRCPRIRPPLTSEAAS